MSRQPSRIRSMASGTASRTMVRRRSAIAEIGPGYPARNASTGSPSMGPSCRRRVSRGVRFARRLHFAAMLSELDRDFTAGLTEVRAAPRVLGRLQGIVRRPAVDVRESLAEAELDEELGLISTRVLRAIEPDPLRWPLAGDQLYVDLDLTIENLPPGSQLAIGSAVIEVSATPHIGCAKFSARFGSDALRWVNSPVGRIHRMRGMNTRIVESGTIRVGD